MHPRVAEGSNLIFRYKFMIRPLVTLRTSESLIIFWLGYITVYLAHTVDPKRLLYCIPALPGTGQLFHTAPLR